MKALSFILFFAIVIIGTTSAQSGSTKSPFSVETVVPPSHQTGKVNYLLSLSDQDFKDKKYVFCTDSNATVAYIKVNGNVVRLTGGANPEGIMAYTCKGYTVTLSNPDKSGINNKDADRNLIVVTSMVIYNQMGQIVEEKVIGAQK